MIEGSGDIRTKRVVVGFDRAELEQQNFELDWWGLTHDNNEPPIISNLPSVHVGSGSRYVRDVDCAFDDDDTLTEVVELSASRLLRAVESRFASSL